MEGVYLMRLGHHRPRGLWWSDVAVRHDVTKLSVCSGTTAERVKEGKWRRGVGFVKSASEEWTRLRT